MIDKNHFQYDLFISYNEADRAWVEGYLLDALKHAGIRYHSASAFALGVPRIVEFERAMQKSRLTLLVLSRAYTADAFNQFTDLLAQNYGLESASWPVLPLILDSMITLPQRLAMLTSLDASDPEYWSTALERLCAELQRPVPASTPRINCPYPGMVPFRARDAQYFFGRDSEIGQVLLHLRHQRFLLVVGPSGSGKSSLIRAGILPHITRSDFFPARSWLVRLIRPSDDPLGALVQAIEGDIRQPAQSLNKLLTAHTPAQRFLLIIDQFEELFTQATPAQQQQFIIVLNEMRTLEQCVIIVIMRADFYPELMNSYLWPIHAAQRIEIVPLRGKALRQAIEQPATDVGVYLEAGLLERLVADAADEPGVLPLLQETMVLLWGSMKRHLLPISTYEQLGSDGRSGLAVAMATKADAALATLSPSEEVLARRIFLRLIQFGEGRADTRRQQHIDALRASDDDPKEFEQTLDYLVKNRLLTLSGEAMNEERRVDIAHEALLSGWTALGTWIRERREAEQVRRRLEVKITEWVRLGQEDGGLLDQAELPEAERWLSNPDAIDLGIDERLNDLIQASQEAIARTEQEREAARQRDLVHAQTLAEERGQANKRLRFRFVAAVIFAVIAAMAASGAFYAFQQAKKQTQTARNLALASAAQASLTQGNTDTALALAVAAAQQEQPQQQAEFVLSQAAYGSSTRKVLVPSSTDEAPTALAFSSDSEQAVVGYSDGSVRIWGLRDGRELHSLPGKAQKVTSIAYDDDASRILAGFENGEVLIYDITHAVSMRFTVADSALIKIGMSKDKMLFVGVEDGSALLLDIATGAVRHKFADKSIAFSAGNRYMLVHGPSSLQLIDLNERKKLADFPELRQDITSYLVSSNGRFVVLGYNNGDVQTIDVANGKEVQSFVGHTGSVRSIAIYKDSYLLTSAFDNGSNAVDWTMRLWDLQSGRELQRYTGHADDITTVIFDSEGRHVLSASEDGTLRLWDVVSGDEQDRFKVADGYVPDRKGPRIGTIPIVLNGGRGNDSFDNGPIVNVAFSQDGTLAVTDSFTQTVRLWDTVTGKPIRDLIKTELSALATNADVSRAAFVVQDRTESKNKIVYKAVIWDVKAGHELRVFANFVFVQSSDNLALSPDGSQLIAANTNNIRRWDVISGRELATLTSNKAIDTVAFSPDGSKIAGGLSKGEVRVWEAVSGQIVGSYSTDANDDVTIVAFSPDERHILAGSYFGRIYLWDIESRQMLQRIEGHNGKITALTFSPDGMHAVSGSKDTTLRLWDLATSQELRRFDGHLNTITRVAFSPDNKSILSGSSDGTIRRWRIDTLTELIAWAQANRYIRPLSCQQRELYQIVPLCNESIPSITATR